MVCFICTLFFVVMYNILEFMHFVLGCYVQYSWIYVLCTWFLCTIFMNLCTLYLVFMYNIHEFMYFVLVFLYNILELCTVFLIFMYNILGFMYVVLGFYVQYSWIMYLVLDRSVHYSWFMYFVLDLYVQYVVSLAPTSPSNMRLTSLLRETSCLHSRSSFETWTQVSFKGFIRDLITS